MDFLRSQAQISIFVVPGPPASVKAVSLDQGSVLVSWLEPSHPNGHITSYRVHMKTMENGRQYIQHYDLFQPEETYYSIRGLNQVRHT